MQVDLMTILELSAQRMRVAATDRGEADRILKVKAADGDVRTKALQGRGITDQRQAIVAGLRDSVDEFRKSVPGTAKKLIMDDEARSLDPIRTRATTIQAP